MKLVASRGEVLSLANDLRSTGNSTRRSEGNRTSRIVDKRPVGLLSGDFKA